MQHEIVETGLSRPGDHLPHQQPGEAPAAPGPFGEDIKDDPLPALEDACLAGAGGAGKDPAPLEARAGDDFERVLARGGQPGDIVLGGIASSR